MKEWHQIYAATISLKVKKDKKSKMVGVEGSDSGEEVTDTFPFLSSAVTTIVNTENNDNNNKHKEKGNTTTVLSLSP